MIILKNVNKTYHANTKNNYKALHNINLELENTGLIFLLGKSGSGKSTLLNILGCLDTVDSGSIKVNDLEITSFKAKEYDAYRNSIIGFIFQEFNLLEHLTVYENISIAKELQENITSNEELDNLLTTFNLKGLGNRKINELSGGQKQRVAIARALIKDPSIILADEPTGNLDETSSQEIFEILKQISKDKLVLVVTHDLEAATKYGDRIIRIKDGKIEEEPQKNSNVVTKMEMKKSKLPWNIILKLTRKNIRNKPFKFAMSIILLTFALTCIGLTFTLFSYNEKELAISVMKKNKWNSFQIEKIEKTKEKTSIIDLTETDRLDLQNLTNMIGNPVYKITNGGNPLSFELDFDFNKIDKNSFYFQNYQSPIIEYIEIKNEDMFPNLIGNIPKSKDEMIIHKYLAEKIIYYGIKDSKNEFYYPTSLEQIIQDHHPLKLEDNTVFISGIINDNNSLFQKSLEKERWFPRIIQDYFRKDYEKNATKVYIKGMTDFLKTNNEYANIRTNLLLEPNANESEFIPLQKEITIVSQDGLHQINALKKEEMILPISYIKQIDEKFKNSYQIFLSTTEETEENITQFLSNYLKNNSFHFHLKLNFLMNNQIERTIEPKMIGISLDNHIYISDEFLTFFQNQTKKWTSIYFYEPNQEKMKNAILNTTFTVPNASGTYQHFFFNFSEDIQSRTTAFESLKIYVAFFGSIVILFALILCLNLINTSVINSKKEIGILRALGTTSKDVQKIFQMEALFMMIISGIFSIIAMILTSIYVNKKTLEMMFYQIDIFHLKISMMMLIFFATLIFSTIITFFASKNITKIKPMDAIQKK